MASFYEEFGANLRAARKRAGLTQQELAERIDLTRTSVTNIERGSQRIALHQLFELANALGDDPLDLLPARERRLEEIVPELALGQFPDDEQERLFMTHVLRHRYPVKDTDK